MIQLLATLNISSTLHSIGQWWNDFGISGAHISHRFWCWYSGKLLPLLHSPPPPLPLSLSAVRLFLVFHLFFSQFSPLISLQFDDCLWRQKLIHFYQCCRFLYTALIIINIIYHYLWLDDFLFGCVLASSWWWSSAAEW